MSTTSSVDSTLNVNTPAPLAWSDRFVTGDARVSPVGRDEVRALARATLGPLRVEGTALFDADRPNYALVFRR